MKGEYYLYYAPKCAIIDRVDLATLSVFEREYISNGENLYVALGKEMYVLRFDEYLKRYDEQHRVVKMICKFELHRKLETFLDE